MRALPDYGRAPPGARAVTFHCVHPFEPPARDLRQLRDETVARLAAAGVSDPEVDAELLLGHVLGQSRGGVQAKLVVGAEVSGEDASALDALVARRVRREPLQHLTGRAAFRSLELYVGPGVFVPRPETEQVTQIAVDALRAVPSPEPVAVDLGSGSGAIAISLATEVPHSRVYAVEKSSDAVEWTRRNAGRFAGSNLAVVHADLAEALPELDGTVDLVISNPPYVPDEAVPRDPEVWLHDPAMALYGGIDGLDVVRALSQRALRLLHPGGLLVIEHGELQAAPIAALLEADGWHGIAHHRDLTSRDRATTALR